MSETVEIKINLSSEHWGGRYPGARVYINDELIHESLIVEPITVFWSGNFDEGDHTVSVEMYNKNPGDTVTDDKENIVNDVMLNIDSVSIDDIDLGLILYKKSMYYPKQEYAPEKVENCVNLGWNGTWKLYLESPVYLWFLENF